MPFSYMIPSISSLPSGYDCTVAAPIGKLAGYLAGATARIVQTVSVFAEGEKIESHEIRHIFEDGVIVGDPAPPFVWHDKLPEGVSGYLENAFRTEDDSPSFVTNAVLPFYSIYNKPGKKTFFSDNAYLYAAPPVIAQIAEYGPYIDGYPVVRVDRERDYGESIIFINPYQKPLKARIMGFDGRAIANIRVPAHSARRASLEALVPEGETRWHGQIQITATNRVITFDVKHSLKDPGIISDHEHLDPYRGEPTHFPASRWLRLKVGEWLMLHGKI
ncbi:MAG: hypothetical protein VW405_16840 [Rhodospirillaceae bacterium]